MRDEMKGCCEHDGADHGLGGPSIVVLAGLDQPFKTGISPAAHAKVRARGDEDRARSPRSIEPPKGAARQAPESVSPVAAARARSA